LFVFGVSILYGFLGSSIFNVLNLLLFENVNMNIYPKIGLLLVLIALLFKIGAAPFHI
jgi:NADH-quinone oxidoreductase subunit N